MNWIPYATYALALVSVTNVIEKFLIEKRINNTLAITIFYGIISCLLGIILLLWKGIHPIPIFSFLWILLSGIFTCWYLLPYFKALAIDEASRVIPLFQLVPIFVLLLSVIFIHDTMTVKEGFGFIVIIIGGTILSVEKIDQKFFRPRKSLWYMMLSSFLYALSVITFKGAAINLDFITSFSYQALGTGIGTLLLLLIPKNFALCKKEIKKLSLGTTSIMVGSHTIGFVGEALWFYALLLAPSALVSAYGGLQPFFVLLYSSILSLFFPRIIKEDLGKNNVLSKLLAISIIGVGIGLIYL